MPSILLSDNGVSSGSAGLKSTAASDGALALQTTTAGGTATTAVSIDTSQNVGIGVSSPSYKLDVDRGASNGVVAKFGRSSGQAAYIYADTSAAYFASNASVTNGLGFYDSSNYFAVFTNGAERLRLDSSGNLGLGVTPSAWATFKVMQIGNGTADTFIAVSGNQGDFGVNAYYNAGWKYQTSSVAASRYEQSSGVHQWFNAPSGTAGNAITFTQAMTLDASGNLIQGGTSVGTMSGNTVHRLANTGIIARTSSSLASGSALNIVVSSGGASFAGFLVVENVVLSNALIRTQTTYSVFGRGTTFTATSIASSNGSSGAASFTVTCPSTGVISVTNTSGSTTGVNMSFFGSEGF